MAKSRVGKKRCFTHPKTKKKVEVATIRDEILVPEPGQPGYDASDWGTYQYGAWLEEDIDSPSVFYISLPYWRNGRFAGQYSLRAEPSILLRLFREIERRGWFEKKGWGDQAEPEIDTKIKSGSH